MKYGNTYIINIILLYQEGCKEIFNYNIHMKIYHKSSYFSVFSWSSIGFSVDSTSSKSFSSSLFDCSIIEKFNLLNINKNTSKIKGQLYLIVSNIFIVKY